MPSSISSSSTSTISTPCSRAIRIGSSPAKGAFSPSAIDSGATGVGSPASSPACSAFDARRLDADDPRASGSAAAIPAIEPPPPTGHDDDVDVRARPRRSPGRPCPARRRRADRRTGGRASGRSPRRSSLEPVEHRLRARRLEVDLARRSRVSRRSSPGSRSATSRAARRALRARRRTRAPARGCRPRRRSRLAPAPPSVSERSLFSTPRGLNEPVRWKSSALRKTRGPSVAELNIGVRWRSSPIVSRAARTSSAVITSRCTRGRSRPRAASAVRPWR